MFASESWLLFDGGLSMNGEGMAEAFQSFECIFVVSTYDVVI